jgi:hypothetical protein
MSRAANSVLARRQAQEGRVMSGTKKLAVVGVFAIAVAGPR